jgi:DNA polymerase III alpha subunit
LQQFESSLAKKIVKEREINGSYYSLVEFTQRIRIGIEQLLILIRAGAFAFTQKTKAQLMWEAHTLVNKKRNIHAEAPMLFPGETRKFRLPQLEQDLITDAYDEIEIIGFPVSLSYFDLLQTGFRGEVLATQMNDIVGKTVRMLGHLVTIKYVKTVKKDYMHFATFLDVKGNFFDTVHFPQSLKYYPFRGDGIYLLKGKIVEEFGYASLEVEKMAKMALVPNPVG